VSAKTGDAVTPLFQQVGMEAMKFEPTTSMRAQRGVVEDWTVGESDCSC
jgi:hypothetical protein